MFIFSIGDYPWHSLIFFRTVNEGEGQWASEVRQLHTKYEGGWGIHVVQGTSPDIFWPKCYHLMTSGALLSK